MCQKRSSLKIHILKKSNGYSYIRVDPCLKNIILLLNERDSCKETLASCCGHGRYPMTIVVRDAWKIFEVFSGIKFSYKKKYFYKKDKDGYFYIPEVMEKMK